MTKLHEILAVEADKEGIAQRIIDETKNIFKSKHSLFQGFNKKLVMKEEGHEMAEKAGSEQLIVSTTVNARLDYTCKSIIAWLDVVSAKEHTNQSNAKADLIIDGKVLVKDLPATFLLGMETKLKKIREIYNLMPTLPPGVQWIPDAVIPDTYNVKDPEVKSKTKKTPQFRIMDKATPHHPAQIEKWTEDTVVGTFTTTHSSGMITAQRKMRLLGRVDILQQAFKQARQRANNVDIAPATDVGKIIFDYINID